MKMNTTSSGNIYQLVRCVMAAALIVTTFQAASVSAESGKKKGSLPSFAVVRKIVDRQLAKRPDYQPGDIISKGDVEPMFRQLAQAGWKVADKKEILDDVLDDSNALVKELRGSNGRQFMRKVSGEKSIYDRLDRVWHHRRGPATIKQLIRLPDGEKYAKENPGQGNPNLSDLVLIYDRGSVDHRKLKDYNKPTGSIYTREALIARLKQSYQKARRSSS